MRIRRRQALALLAATTAPAVWAAQKKSLADPLRLGVEQGLLDAGLAVVLQKSFGRDTGVAVQLVPGRSVPLLEALERGEIDASMTNAPDQEKQLEKQGLAADRRQVAIGDYVLVGPLEGTGKKAKDPAGVAGERDVAVALSKIAAGQFRFIGAPSGSGGHLAALALWRAAQVTPTAAWHFESKGNPLEQAFAENAYTLVERGLWLAKGRKPLAILCENDPRMQTAVHMMRSFRVSHPATKLFSQWLESPAGRRVTGSARGWRAPPR